MTFVPTWTPGSACLLMIVPYMEVSDLCDCSALQNDLITISRWTSKWQIKLSTASHADYQQKEPNYLPLHAQHLWS